MKRKEKRKPDYKPEVVRLAAGLCGVVMNNATADMLIEITNAIKKHGDNFSLRHATDIEYKIEQKYKAKKTITAEAKNPYAKENGLLREGLRVGVDMLRDLKKSEKVNLSRKAKGLIDDFVIASDQLLGSQK